MPLYAFGPVQGTFLQDGNRILLLEHRKQFTREELWTLAKRVEDEVLGQYRDDPEVLFELGMGYMESELLEKHGFRKPEVAEVAVMSGPYSSQRWLPRAATYPVSATVTMAIEADSPEAAREHAELVLRFGSQAMRSIPAATGTFGQDRHGNAHGDLEGTIDSIGEGVPIEYGEDGFRVW